MPRTDFSTWGLSVRGSGGQVYTVTIASGRPVECTCPSYMHRDGPKATLGGCKHMRARVGPGSIGTTRCARCRSFLTPSDFDYDAKITAAESSTESSIVCMSCEVRQQS